MKKLFQPVKIRGQVLKNAAVVPPMVCYNYAGEDGYVTDRNVEHYKTFVQGGFGLIIQEATCVSKTGKLVKTQLGIWEDGQIEGLRKITDAVHEQDGKIYVQIHHAGIMGVTPPLACPSDFKLVKPDGTEAEAKEMPREKVEEVKAQFIEAGRRAYEAGYDGVELHGCHNYLLCQFLNSRVNTRKDVYGTEPERIVIDILNGIREKTSEDFVIGIRLGGFEPALQDAVKHARTLQEAGIDFLNISYGFMACSSPEKPEGFPYRDIIYAAQEIKKAVDIPVFTVFGINSAGLAEDILETTGVDMVNIGRGALVNPNWVKDAMADRDTGKCFECKTCMWRVDAEKCPGRLKYFKQ